ncbi:MAG: SMP-30/gluconolactonase/LRE family protein [Pseudomonadota bacterium]
MLLLLLGVLVRPGLAATGSDTTGVADRYRAFYPEGLSRIGDELWFGEMSANRITRWRAGRTLSFSMPPGCGPTAVEGYGRGLMVLCHLNNRVVLMSVNGEVQDVRTQSVAGLSLRRPNDAVRDDRGGVYFSSSGEFAPAAPIAGQIFYLYTDGRIQRVAGNIHYANGVEFDAVRQRLLVSSHLGRQILKFPVHAPGKLGPAEILHNLKLPLAGFSDWWTGPDGLHLDADGTLRIAIYGAGRLLALNGGRMHWIPVRTRFVTTVLNDALLGMFVGGTFDLNDPQLRGELVRFRPGVKNWE